MLQAIRVAATLICLKQGDAADHDCKVRWVCENDTTMTASRTQALRIRTCASFPLCFAFTEDQLPFICEC